MCCIFISTLPASCPYPQQPLIFVHFYNFVISRVSLTGKHTVCDLLGSALLTQHNSPRIHGGCFVYNSSSFLIAEEYFMVWMNHSLFNCSITYPLKGIWVISSLGLLRIKLLLTLVYRFANKHIDLHFSGISAQESNCWVVWWLQV